MRIRFALVIALMVSSLLAVGCNISQADYADALAEANAAKSQVSSLEQELSEVKSDLEQATQDLEAAEKFLEEKQDLLSMTDEDIIALQNEVTSMQNEVSSLEDEISDLEDSLEWEQEKQDVVIDQMAEPNWSGAFDYVASTSDVGQTFTPKYPVLAAVEVSIITANPTRGDDTLIMTILDEDGDDLATKSLDVENGFDGWLRFEFDKKVKVSVNDLLTILIEDGGNTVFGWRYYGSNYYKFGDRTVSGVPEDGDFLFRTYGLK